MRQTDIFSLKADKYSVRKRPKGLLYRQARTVQMASDPTTQDTSRPRGNSWPICVIFKKCAHLMLDVTGQSARDGLVTLAPIQLDLDHG